MNYRSLIFLCMGLMAYCNTAHAQSDTLYVTHKNPFEIDQWLTDTLYYPSSDRGIFLYGTTPLPSTRRMASASRGYWLNQALKLPCSGSEESPTASPPPVCHFTDSTLTIDFTITDNCCYDFLCEIEVNDEGDMRLYTQGYGGYCACYCCFGMQFQILLQEGRVPLRALFIGDNTEPVVRF